MLDFSRLERYRENNRIEAKKALGGLPKSIWGDLLRLRQHAGRHHPAGRYRDSGQDLRFRRSARSRQPDP